MAMRKPLGWILAGVALTFTLGLNGSCVEPHDVEIVTLAGRPLAEAKVVIMGVRSGEKVIMSWREFEKPGSLRDVELR
jgi:hypothetical protein